jgi:dihydroorotase
MVCSIAALFGSRPMTRALMMAATAESTRSQPPIRRMASGRSARGHTIGTPRAVPMPEPVRPTTANSMVPITMLPVSVHAVRTAQSARIGGAVDDVQAYVMTHRVGVVSVFIVCLFLVVPATPSGVQTFDLVIVNGRVVDPESGLDAVRNIGIRGDRIIEIGTQPLDGSETIDARGLVVSPGFIDIHRHAHGDASYRYAARDGVTSAFELEIGAADVDAWYRMVGPARLINFGVGAGHIGARMQVLGDKGFMMPVGPGRGPATEAQIAEILKVIEAGLGAGGVAVGMGIAYTPRVSPEEVAAVFRLAARHGAFVHAHLGNGVASLTTLLGLSRDSGAALHVAHINSTAGGDIQTYLSAVNEARAGKVDVTTEVYPYTAGATLIQSALYDNWETWPEERFGALQWAATGERLTRETFAKYRAQGGSVISHSNTEESLRIGIADPLPMFASDGGRDAEDNPTHPRATGTFARILGHYVREHKVLSLRDAIRRMTIEPARRLEPRVPDMRDRGRLRAGAYADITVFDPVTVIDRSTYTNAAAYSEGILHVVVNGVPIVRHGNFETHATLQGQRIVVGSRMPGRPIRAPQKP